MKNLLIHGVYLSALLYLGYCFNLKTKENIILLTDLSKTIEPCTKAFSIESSMLQYDFKLEFSDDTHYIFLVKKSDTIASISKKTIEFLNQAKQWKPPFGYPINARIGAELINFYTMLLAIEKDSTIQSRLLDKCMTYKWLENESKQIDFGNLSPIMYETMLNSLILKVTNDELQFTNYVFYRVGCRRDFDLRELKADFLKNNKEVK
jgi:hypothetical protein